ncbi:MAG: CapA family protein [Bacteroidales bacterium]|nr:CapA family protein [Bacteroidales bacterium]
MNKVRIFFAGDFCSKPSTSRITVSDKLKKLIQSCDLKVVNFEAPLKPEVKLPPQRRERFFQNDDAPAFLRGLGFNLFSQANNHAFDWGDEGFKKTKAALGDAAFGAGTYEEAYQVKVVEVQGVKIGFYALSFAAYKGVFDDVMNHEGLGCAYINDLRVNHDIMEAKKLVDYLFILPHDGIEYIDVPTPETIARYRDFIDYGADGVIAAHPHCPQGWEEYKGKPIFYSLGNFFFNSKASYDFRADKPHWYEGLCVVMNIFDGKLSWEVVNTKNVDNICIELDCERVRIKQNEQLCRYLTNPEEYLRYFKKTCKQLGQEKEMLIIDKTFHPNSLSKCTLFVMKHWFDKIKRKDFTNDDELVYLVKNDQRRNIVIRSIYNKIFDF